MPRAACQLSGPSPISSRWRRRSVAQRCRDQRQIEDALVTIQTTRENQPQGPGRRPTDAPRQRNAERNVVDALGTMRQTLEQLFVHPAADGDVRVNDAIVLDGQIVVVVVVAVENEHDRAADVVYREHRQVEQVAGHDDPRPRGNDPATRRMTA